MPLLVNNMLSVISGLVEICKDGEQGFKNAADDVNDANLKKLFTEYSNQREKFMYELRELAKTFGSDLEFSGSILGVLHRRWMDIKFGIAGSNTESILKECLRGEEAAVRKYKVALKIDLSEPFAKVVKRQSVEIIAVYANLTKQLEFIENHALEL